MLRYSTAYSTSLLWCLMIILVPIWLRQWRCFYCSPHPLFLFYPSHLRFHFIILHPFHSVAQAQRFTTCTPKFNPVVRLDATTCKPILNMTMSHHLNFCKTSANHHHTSMDDWIICFFPDNPFLIAAMVIFQRTNRNWLYLLKTPQSLLIGLRI